MNEVNKMLLQEYHAGRATALQRKLIEDWLKDSTNRPLFYETLYEWEVARPQYVANLNAGLERYRQRMDTLEPTPSLSVIHNAATGPSVFTRRLYSSWFMAASVMLTLLAGGWFFRKPILYKTYATNFGQVEQVTLPDGSGVTLNGNSSLRLLRFDLNKEEPRNVYLTGEAEFSVTHTTDNRRFIVHTDRGLDVEVLGTEFVVLARNRATRVVLTKGKVKLHYHTPNKPDRQLTMVPGQQVTVDARQQQLAMQTVPRPEVVSAWKNHQYVFEDTPLAEIGQMIQDDFGLKVEIRETALAKRQVSGTYDATNADELLSALEELLLIQITRQRNRVIFSQKAD